MSRGRWRSARDRRRQSPTRPPPPPAGAPPSARGLVDGYTLGEYHYPALLAGATIARVVAVAHQTLHPPNTCAISPPDPRWPAAGRPPPSSWLQPHQPPQPPQPPPRSPPTGLCSDPRRRRSRRPTTSHDVTRCSRTSTAAWSSCPAPVSRSSTSRRSGNALRFGISPDSSSRMRR